MLLALLTTRTVNLNSRLDTLLRRFDSIRSRLMRRIQEKPQADRKIQPAREQSLKTSHQVKSLPTRWPVKHYPIGLAQAW